MAHRKNKVDCTWTADLAYVVGIFTSDGNLSNDGRHLNVTSKDYEIVETVRSILHLNNVIGTKSRGKSFEQKYFVLQFGDVHFYEFLLSIGLHPAKSKTLEKVVVPDCFFPDFLRGCIDGDGCIDSFMHPESKRPQIKIRLASASPLFLTWMHKKIHSLTRVSGGFVVHSKSNSVSTLVFAKYDSLFLIAYMYYVETLPSLKRKRDTATRLFTANMCGN